MQDFTSLREHPNFGIFRVVLFLNDNFLELGLGESFESTFIVIRVNNILSGIEIVNFRGNSLNLMIELEHIVLAIFI